MENEQKAKPMLRRKTNKISHELENHKNVRILMHGRQAARFRWQILGKLSNFEIIKSRRRLERIKVPMFVKYFYSFLHDRKNRKRSQAPCQTSVAFFTALISLRTHFDGITKKSPTHVCTIRAIKQWTCIIIIQIIKAEARERTEEKPTTWSAMRWTESIKFYWSLGRKSFRHLETSQMGRTNLKSV